MLWDYCAERRAAITNMTEKNLFQLQGQNAHTTTYGEQGDISNIFQFGWYEWVYARDGSELFSRMTEILLRCLGPTKNEGNEMTQWILKINRKVLTRRSLRKLHPDEMSKETDIAKRSSFDVAIKMICGDYFTVPEKEFEPNPKYAWDGEDHPIPFPEADVLDEKVIPINTSSLADTLITSEVVLPHG